MPVVDLDDELSIVDEGAEDMRHDNMGDANSTGQKSEISAMTDLSPMASPGANSEDEREQQWIIDSILQHKGDSSPTPGKGSETDDSSLYLQDMDESPTDTKQSTPKTKNKKEAPKVPSPDDTDYHNYMDVSGILDNFEEEEDQGGWRGKVASSLKPKKPLDKAKKSAKTEEVKTTKSTTSQPKESWRGKNLFRGSKTAQKTSSQEKARKQSLASDPHETNLAPLANIDRVDSNKGNKQSESWMPKVSFLGSSKAQAESKVDDFEEHYASNLAPRGNEDDLEANLDPIPSQVMEEKPEVQDSWSSKVTSFISTVTESKQETEVTDKPEDKELAETTDLTTDLVSSIESDTKTMIENEVIDEEKAETKQSGTNPFGDEDEDQKKGEVSTGVNPFSDDTDEFVANETQEDADDGMVTAWVGNTSEAEVQDSDDQANKTWKSKVKSVRKSSSNKLSSIRKKSGRSLARKSFTEDKMKQLEVAKDDKTVETGKTIDTNSTLNNKNKGPSQVPGRRKKILIVLGGAVLLILLIVGVSVGTSKRGSSDNETPAPPQQPDIPVEDLEYLYRLMYPISGDGLLVEDPDSPLVKAFIWTASDKAARPDDSDDETIRRYVSAVTYYTLGGESWTNQNNFLSQEDLCEWNDAQQSGIICEADKEIKELQLSDNNLSGNIPEEIMYLSSLKMINMANNGITGGVPGTIGQMNSLQGLNLSSNSMTGELPSSLFDSKRLSDIMLDDNDFSGTIGDMSNLERFTASGNAFSGPVPPTIGSSSALKVLDLSSNDLTGTIPDFTSESPIELLHLNRNDISGSIPSRIGNLQNLASLRLRMNDLTGTIPRQLGNCLRLRDILLDNNYLEGSIPEEIAELPELESLLVSENKGITGGAGPFCEREDTLDMFGVSTCGEQTVDCPCCNICCQSEPEYGCFEISV